MSAVSRHKPSFSGYEVFVRERLFGLARFCSLAAREFDGAVI